MNISVQKLLRKIEEELQQAKGSRTDAQIRERVHAIKTLCELVLDEPSEVRQQHENPPSSSPVMRSTTYEPSKKLDLAEEANGDSLFDF